MYSTKFQGPLKLDNLYIRQIFWNNEENKIIVKGSQKTKVNTTSMTFC